MARKSLMEQLIEAIADFIGGFIVMCLLLIPFAYMWVGIEGVAILVFIVIVIGSCMLLSGNDDKNKSKYQTDYKMKKCPNCGKEIADFAQICKYCRTNLKPKPTTKKMKMKKCPNCGKEIYENAFKCKYCKKKLK